MMGVSQHAHQGALEDELCALQILCQETGSNALRERAIVLLAAYRFLHPQHQLVFDALGSISPNPPETIRTALINRLTSLGFPDIDVEPFFRRHTMNDEQALSIMEKLAHSAGHQPQTQTGPR